ncbi:hypothetical protein MBOU_51750 [Mycobacterium bourgelatii]|uniref:Uncharacterized protein n=1 Tax=Mycobacterium bourgelatii TaxID=1273442 RepID=A0A7I9YX04_MYCBU|nr:hypothetical protein MBOU_51750 [Mycobacterium bourgelatii]
MAASKALATALACPAASAAWAEAAFKNAEYGEAAAAIAVADGPCQAPLTKSEVTEEKEFAAALSSSANPDHAAEACNIGAEPAPRYIRNELISGGKTKKLTIVTSVNVRRFGSSSLRQV